MSAERHPNILLVERLYTALKNHNPDAIAACYADDAYFEDIAFRLHGKKRIHDMWRLVCRARPEVTIDSISADDRKGSGHWRAHYGFKATENGRERPVENTLASEFTFRDGLIVEHRDRSNVWKWAWQAYPIWASPFVASIGPLRRYGAARKLDKFIDPTPPQSFLDGLKRPVRRYMSGP